MKWHEAMDTATVDSARRGDEQAFVRLVERNHRAVHGVAFRAAGDWAAAEDITQETFRVAWNNLSRLRQGKWIGRRIECQEFRSVKRAGQEMAAAGGRQFARVQGRRPGRPGEVRRAHHRACGFYLRLAQCVAVSPDFLECLGVLLGQLGLVRGEVSHLDGFAVGFVAAGQ